jgi:hypothetical protein
MSTEFTFDCVATFEVRGIIPGEFPMNNWHKIRVYRTRMGKSVKYSVHYEIDHYHFDDNNQVVPDKMEAEQDDFEDGAAADAKFQHLCLKAFASVMASRNKSY